MKEPYVKITIKEYNDLRDGFKVFEEAIRELIKQKQKKPWYKFWKL